MTASTLRKYKTITYDEKGKPASVSLNLKNKLMKKAYEKVMEEIEDALDVKEAMNRLEDGQKCIPWDEAVKRYMMK